LLHLTERGEEEVDDAGRKERETTEDDDAVGIIVALDLEVWRSQLLSVCDRGGFWLKFFSVVWS
jgi:hypothetical protein